jgi:alpha-glucoside transport system permease protein
MATTLPEDTTTDEETDPTGTGPDIRAGTGRRMVGRELGYGLLFLVPALVLLGAMVVYPVFFTIVRSLFSDTGDNFVGLDQYREMIEKESTRTAITNNVVWVVTAPILAAAIGLVFAVLTERIKFGTAFKLLIFMPMAISFLAAGVIFRFVYDDNPDVGLLNALSKTVVDVFRDEGDYPGANPVDESFVAVDGGFVSHASLQPGDTARVGIVGFPPADVSDDAERADEPVPVPGAVTGTVWLDFSLGGGGERGVIDDDELGLPGFVVEVVDESGEVVGGTRTDEAGRFVIEDVGGPVSVRLAESNFREPWPGKRWLGPSLVTPAVIGSFLWIWTGFAMMLIAAGLASIPRETMEAARVDGANEWQVFRRVTVPLLAPVLLVVVVTLMINVLKIFDLVLVIPPGSVQDDANVIALELWRVSFGGARDQGLGSALGVLLFLLVVPAMIFNIKRFRSEEG